MQTPEDFAILDSGATAHFIIQGANVLNQQPTTQPLHIKLPNGSIIKSTHTCNLNIPWLPTSMTEAHIVPGLTHSSLVATKKFCDAGCTVTFDADKCHIFHQDNLVLEGIRDKGSFLLIQPHLNLTQHPHNSWYHQNPCMFLATSTLSPSNNNNSNICTKHSSVHQSTRWSKPSIMTSY